MPIRGVLDLAHHEIEIIFVRYHSFWLVIPSAFLVWFEFCSCNVVCPEKYNFPERGRLCPHEGPVWQGTRGQSCLRSALVAALR
jgi:hypothetical protein